MLLHQNIFMKKLLLATVTLCLMAAHAFSQAPAQPVHPALRPPKGATVALVIFEDLECPDCARAAPLLEEASRTYKIPVVRHDFPLPMVSRSAIGGLLPSLVTTPKNWLSCCPYT